MQQYTSRNRNAAPWLHYALMAAFAFLAYWPLSTFHHPTKWDSVETYFPFRFFLSDCLRNGEWPLWLPYQLGGYPFYADPQSGAWYPLAWIFCSPAPYTLKSLAVEFLCTVFIGGLGMYRLIKSFELDDYAALLAGVSYIACGFFISNAEHLTWVVSAAWLPWIFWSYHRQISTGKIGYALLGGLFLFLLLSGGYPAFITVALYLIILFFLIKMIRKQSAADRWELVWQHGLLAATFVLLSAGAVWSWLQFMPLMSRGVGMSLDAVQVFPFSPRCMESLFLPFATLKGDEIYDADISMRNGYMGLCCLLMLPFISLRKNNRKLLLIAIVSLLCLATAMGSYMPVRAWLYDYVPMMRLFRFPSLFRIFFMIGAIVIAAHGAHTFLQDISGRRRKLGLAALALLTVFLTILVLSVADSGFVWHWGRSSGSFKAHLYEAARFEHIQLQSLLQIGLTGGLLILCLMKKGRWLRPETLIVFCMADLFLASALNAYGTVVDMQRRNEMEAPIVNAPRSFLVPDPGIPVSAYGDGKRALGALRTNTSIYFKTPAEDGYNSFTLNSFNKLGASPIHDSVWVNPYLYFAGGVYSMAYNALPRSHADLGVSPRDYERLKSISFSPDTGRTIRVSSFRPNEIAATVHVSDTSLLNLQQNFATDWALFVDGSRTEVFMTNLTQMAGIIPPGEHQIIWRFDPQEIKILAGWTLLELGLLIAGMVVYRKTLW